MHEFAKPAVLDHAAEIEIQLGAGEIVRSDGDRRIGGRPVSEAERAQRQRCKQGTGRATEQLHFVPCDHSEGSAKALASLAANSGFGPFRGAGGQPCGPAVCAEFRRFYAPPGASKRLRKRFDMLA